MEKLGPYRIIKTLSDRSRDNSYQAWDDNLNRAVYLRPIPDTLGSDKDGLEQFVAGQKRLTRHNQNHSIQFLETITIDEQLYFAREFIDGESLAEKIAEQPLGRMLFYSLALQILQGLMIAHQYGIVHGHVTPENIIITTRGQVHLTEAGWPAGDISRPSRVHIAPELRDSSPASEAGDLFAVGVLFYRMLTGQEPWTEGRAESVDWMLNFESPAGRLIDRENRLLIEKLISSDPIDRGSPQEILDSLRMMLQASDSPTEKELDLVRKSPKRWSARSLMVLSALSMLLVIFWLVLTTVARQ